MLDELDIEALWLEENLADFLEAAFLGGVSIGEARNDVLALPYGDESMELRPVIDSFYDRLILRDLIGKVVPGGLLVLSPGVGAVGLDVSSDWLQGIPFMVWIIFIGFSWLLAFVLQYIGELLRLLKTHPRAKDGSGDRQEFYEAWVKFHDVASPAERVHAERINVIREACGNGAISVGLCCVLVPLTLSSQEVFRWNPTGLILVVAIGIAFCLWRMHVIHVGRYGEFVQNTVRFRAKNSDPIK